MLHSRKQLHAFTEQLAQQDAMMAELIEEFGMPTFKPWRSDPFTLLIGSITSQQLSTKAANTIFGRVAERFSYSSDTVTTKSTKNNSRLDPEKLAESDIETLRSCGLSNAKSNYCIGIAQAVVNKTISFRKIKKMPQEEAIQSLTQLKGVGIWTAEMFLIFALGHKDIFAVDDLGLQKGVQSLFNLKTLPDKKKMLRCAEKWRPYRSVASWYLWRHLESK